MLLNLRDRKDSHSDPRKRKKGPNHGVGGLINAEWKKQQGESVHKSASNSTDAVLVASLKNFAMIT